MLRVVKKESVAKFRISWRGGTDVTIRSLPLSCFGDLRTSVKEGESRGEREARTLHYALRTRFPNNFLLKVTRRKERFLSENFSFSFFPLNVSSSFFSSSPPRFHFGLEK